LQINRRLAGAVAFAPIACGFEKVPIHNMVNIRLTGQMFFASQVLETATQDSARMIMTG